jgi:hypothetical protein
MASFASNFSAYADVISRISVSMGPAGELRYPSYNFSAGWNYPQRGSLQAYSTAARRSLRAHARRQYADDLALLNRAWGTELKSFDEVQPPSDGDHFFRTATQTPYGRDFLAWYQSGLEGHLKRMMELARKRLRPTLPARLTAKVASVHWLYNSPDMPHAAELTAGYADYGRLVARFAEADVDLTFTALEMDDVGANDVGPGNTPPFSAPQTLARKIASLSREHGVVTWGENALSIHGDSRLYRNIGAMLAEGYSGFSLLRLNHIVDAAGQATSEMGAFVRYVVSPPSAALRFKRPAVKGGAPVSLLAWTALAGGLLLGAPSLLTDYDAMAKIAGWVANVVFLFFPWVQFLENFRNGRALRRGGEEAWEADKRLGGVSAGSQMTLIAGNMLNYPSFLVGANAALIANSLLGAAGSLAILLQLALTGHFSRGRLALATVAVAAATVLPLILPVPASVFPLLAIVAASIFSTFTVPQIFKNRESLAALRNRSSDPQAAHDALQKLSGVRPRYLLVGLLGNLLLVPVFISAALWWNLAGGMVTIIGSLFILGQLAQAGLFPKSRLAWLTAGASSFLLAMALGAI